MDYPHKIPLSHPAVFEHHHLDGKISILISKKCLLIDFLSVSAVSDSETLSASGHVIFVESEVKIMLELILKKATKAIEHLASAQKNDAEQ